MKILWVVSQIPPDAAKKLGIGVFATGGWVHSMLMRLCGEEIELAVALCYSNTDSIIKFEENKIRYFVLPITGKNKNVSPTDCRAVLSEFKPDLIHIEGTEFSISERFSEIKEYTNIISMQGIINAYEPYQYGELPVADFMFSRSLKKLITGWTLFFRKRFLFDNRLEAEKNTIRNADNIMGRTLWDRAHSYVFNKKANYYSCNRTLRETFYSRKWSYESCNKHSVFVGNGYSALKGVHTVIDAVKILADEYPDIILKVAGVDPYIHSKSDVKKRVGYSYYLRKLLDDPVIKNKVFFVGVQNEENMARRLLESNLYVLPSIIENSPNTLGEAMIMGVPCVSAYTGGASEMAIDEREALFYRAGDAQMLAWQVKRIFDMKDGVKDMCEAAVEHARKTHDPQKNLDDLIYAYKTILSGGK